MTSRSDTRDTPAQAREVTAARIAEMDAAAEDMHPQRYKASIQHQHTSWTTPVERSLPYTSVNLEDRPSNNDVKLRRASFGGNDGRGGAFFSGLTKQKRTDSAWFQSSFEEQAPPYGVLEKLYRKWVTGKSVPNTYQNIKKGEHAHPHSDLFAPPK